VLTNEIAIIEELPQLEIIGLGETSVKYSVCTLFDLLSESSSHNLCSLRPRDDDDVIGKSPLKGGKDEEFFHKTLDFE